MAENRNIFPDRSNIFLVQLIDGQDYSWNAVAPDILGLKNRLGFGNDLSFLHVRLADEGTFWFENPVDSTKTVVQDEVFGYKARRVLFYYSRGDETLQVPEEREIFTKISLLDDSMHSTAAIRVKWPGYVTMACWVFCLIFGIIFWGLGL